MSAGQLFNTLISRPRPSDAPFEWTSPGDLKEARGLLKDFCPAAQKIWSHVDSCMKWTLGEVKDAQYVSSTGRCVLIGDAAHAFAPHSGQGAAMALEDAVALAESVSNAQHESDLSRSMTAFQNFRKPRVENVRTVAYGNQEFFCMEDGPKQQERDALWAAMTKAWKAEWRELGDEGYKSRPKPKAVPSQDMRSPEGRMYVYGYDVFSEVEKAMV